METAPIPKSFAHYFAAWNEPDPQRIAAHLERALSPHVLFVDPANRVQGPSEVGAMMRSFRATQPNARFRLSTGIDGHNRRYRYRWEMVIEGRAVLLGMDVTTVDEHDRIERIDGFFGEFPPPPAAA